MGKEEINQLVEGFEFQVEHFEPNPLENNVSLHFKKEETHAI